MKTIAFEKSKPHIISEIIDYVPHSIGIKVLLKKKMGNISMMSFECGEGLSENTSPNDSFAYIIEGNAEIIIDGISFLLETGESIIIPAYLTNQIIANENFKMIITTIKSKTNNINFSN